MAKSGAWGQNSGSEEARIHDLRRTMGSWQAITGASLDHRQKFGARLAAGDGDLCAAQPGAGADGHGEGYGSDDGKAEVITG